MRRLSLFTVLACAAASAILAIAVTASASAAELPEFSVEPAEVTATFGTSKLNTSGAEIKSTEGVFNDYEKIGSKRLFRGLIWFKNSSLGGQECHSEGDAAGNILVPVEVHLVPGPGHVLYRIVFLVKLTKIVCKFFSTKVTVEEGSTIVGGIAAKAGTEKEFTLEVNVIEKKQQFTEWENDAGADVKAGLKLKVNGIAASGTQEDQAATVVTSENTKLEET